MEKKFNATEKFCTKCGKKFQAVGREVICPSCKEKAMEEAKKNAVLVAKRKSWAGEAVPVRISGRASTVIRTYAKANSLPFVEALDELLRSTDCFKSMSTKWEDIEPYKSTRRKKGAEGEQAEEQEKPSVKPATAPVKASEKASEKAVVVTMGEKKKVARATSKASKASKATK